MAADGDGAALAAILVISWVLRIVIAVRGGQYFWTDESAFVLSQRAAADLLAGQFHAGVDELFAHSAHMLFEVIGVLPAAVQIETGGAVWLPAVFFGSFSVGAVYLMSRLVRVLGGSAREGLFAALLTASCTEFFYYARHIFPYDLALFFFLSAAWYGFRPGRAGSLWAGVLAGLGFLTYNAYWWFGGTMLILTVLSRREPLRRRIERGGVTLAGLALPIAAVIGVARLLGHHLVGEFYRHAYLVSADTGDRGIAWRVIPQYLWVSERYLFWFLILASVAALGWWAAGRLERRIKLWLVGGLVFYLGQVAVFDLLRLFFVCARHARPLAIFLCLIGGWFLAQLAAAGRAGRIATGLATIAILGQAALNFRPPLGQMFPPEFTREAGAMIKADADLDPGLYRILEGGYGESAEDELVRNRPHIVLYERPHPLEFLPYSFDDHTESLRTKFRSRDISMQAIRLTPELPAYGGELPGNERPETPEGGAFRLGLIFDPGKSAEAQPILSTGRQGAGDEVFVQFLGPHAIRFGFDHWSQPATFSAPITCDLGEPHLLTISVAPLYPEPSRALPGGASSPLRNMVFLVFDGKSVLLRRIKCYPAIPRSIVLFHNFLGFSTAARDFSGRVLSVHRVSAEEIGREMTAGSLGSD